MATSVQRLEYDLFAVLCEDFGVPAVSQCSSLRLLHLVPGGALEADLYLTFLSLATIRCEQKMIIKLKPRALFSQHNHQHLLDGSQALCTPDSQCQLYNLKQEVLYIHTTTC